MNTRSTAPARDQRLRTMLAVRLRQSKYLTPTNPHQPRRLGDPDPAICQIVQYAHPGRTIAEQFFISIVGIPQRFALLGLREPPDQEQRRLRAAVGLFLAEHDNEASGPRNCFLNWNDGNQATAVSKIVVLPFLLGKRTKQKLEGPLEFIS